MVDLLKTRTKRDDMQLLAKRIEISQNDEIKMMQTWLIDRHSRRRWIARTRAVMDDQRPADGADAGDAHRSR